MFSPQATGGGERGLVRKIEMLLSSFSSSVFLFLRFGFFLSRQSSSPNLTPPPQIGGSTHPVLLRSRMAGNIWCTYAQVLQPAVRRPAEGRDPGQPVCLSVCLLACALRGRGQEEEGEECRWRDRTR